jgi:hypothetical protein
LDLQALGVRQQLDALAVLLARAATAFMQRCAWTEFGFARLEDHARERFGRSGRWVRDLAAVGRGLEELPLLEAGLAGRDGGPPLGLVAARLISGIADGESAAAWISVARTFSIRELKGLLRKAREAGSRWPPVGKELAAAGGQGSPDADGQESLDAGGKAPAEEDDDDAVRLHLRLPRPVRAAWDEAHELYRAIEGWQAGRVSFVEALVAEAAAGGEQGDNQAGSIHPAGRQRLREAALARETDNWRLLPPPLMAGDTAEGFIGRDAHLVDPEACIRQLLTLQETLEKRLGDLLADMDDRHTWQRLRFAGLGHYAEQRLGLSRNTATERAYLVRTLRSLPVLREAYEAGKLGLTAALHLARFFDARHHDPGHVEAGMQEAWVTRAQEITVKRLDDEIRAVGRRVAGLSGPLDDTAWHASLRRQVGTAQERVRDFGGAAVEKLRVASVPYARVDDAGLTLSLPEDLAGPFLGAIESARRRLAREAQEHPEGEHAPADGQGEAGTPPASHSAARLFSSRARPVPAWVGLLALLEDFVATWDVSHAPRRPVRDAIYVRDGWR